MADHSSHSADHAGYGESDAHAAHGSGSLYFLVFIALCVLTAVSFGSFYAFHNMPHVGWAVMMAVSCMKASLVIMFFMHLLWEANWKYVLTFPAMFMSLFLLLMLVPDVGRRMHYYSPYREVHAAEPVPNAKYEVGAVIHDPANSLHPAGEHSSSPAAEQPANSTEHAPAKTGH